MEDIFWTHGARLIKEVSKVCQRNGKLLTVDLSTDAMDLSDDPVPYLERYLPYLLEHGVVGIDLRIANHRWGFYTRDEVETRFEAVQDITRKHNVKDFVIHLVIECPAASFDATTTVSHWLEAGATVVTVLRRLPSKALSKKDLKQLVSSVQGPLGAVLQFGLPESTNWIKESDLAKAGVARISFGNQWPYFIRRMFNEIMELQFSDQVTS